ncbi:hypothetical protein TWF730_007386 [Orbilia blumenaviensis]|uniref:Uncharacterized protein n=1 Tax=Orbilia blumenaviensis TaxID=1796055 RepID=A0AAV9V7X3_9PEZI
MENEFPPTKNGEEDAPLAGDASEAESEHPHTLIPKENESQIAPAVPFFRGHRRSQVVIRYKHDLAALGIENNPNPRLGSRRGLENISPEPVEGQEENEGEEEGAKKKKKRGPGEKPKSVKFIFSEDDDEEEAGDPFASHELRSKRGAGKKLGALDEQNIEPPTLEAHLPPAERFAQILQWYAVHEAPKPTDDPEGYMKMIPFGQNYMCYSNVLGVQPWVAEVIKKVLHWRYINHPRTLEIDLRRNEDKTRLTEEINITFRNYGTLVRNLLLKQQVPPEKLESKIRQYEAMKDLTLKVHKIGSHKVSGYLLYKLAEGLMKEVIEEKKAILAGFISRADVVPGKPAAFIPKELAPPSPKRRRVSPRGPAAASAETSASASARGKQGVGLESIPEEPGVSGPKKPILLRLTLKPGSGDQPTDDNDVAMMDAPGL